MSPPGQTQLTEQNRTRRSDRSYRTTTGAPTPPAPPRHRSEGAPPAPSGPAGTGRASRGGTAGARAEPLRRRSGAADRPPRAQGTSAPLPQPNPPAPPRYLDLVHAAGAPHHLHAVLHQRPRHGRADAHRGAGDQRHAPGPPLHGRAAAATAHNAPPAAPRATPPRRDRAPPPAHARWPRPLPLATPRAARTEFVRAQPQRFRRPSGLCGEGPFGICQKKRKGEQRMRVLQRSLKNPGKIPQPEGRARPFEQNPTSGTRGLCGEPRDARQAAGSCTEQRRSAVPGCGERERAHRAAAGPQEAAFPAVSSRCCRHLSSSTFRYNHPTYLVAYFPPSLNV